MPAVDNERRWLVLGVLSLIVLIVVIDNTIVAMALPLRAADSRAVKSRVAPSYPEMARRFERRASLAEISRAGSAVPIVPRA